jgi:hypothetical protein
MYARIGMRVVDPTSTSGDGARSRVRLLVAGILCVFALQVVYVMRADEPYPALMMPRFSSAGPWDDGDMKITLPEIAFSYSDGKTVQVTQSELLRHVPEGHHSRIMQNLLSLRPEQPVTRRAPPGKFEPPPRVFPGYQLALVSRNEAGYLASLREWLRRRANAEYAGATPTRCVTSWYIETFPGSAANARQGRATGRELIGRLEVELGEAASRPR